MQAGDGKFGCNICRQLSDLVCLPQVFRWFGARGSKFEQGLFGESDLLSNVWASRKLPEVHSDTMP